MSIRKLAELWEVDGDYQIRVEVGAFQRALTSDAATAEQLASFEVVEVLRKIVQDADGGLIEHRADTELEPRE